MDPINLAILIIIAVSAIIQIIFRYLDNQYTNLMSRITSEILNKMV